MSHWILYYSDNRDKECDVGGACNMHGIDRIADILVRKPLCICDSNKSCLKGV